MNAKPLLLIAEDDPLIIATLEMLLTGEGYEVLTATDGQVALDLLLAGAKPALILSDIRMPNKNGYELLRSVRSLPAFDDVPFIFLSAKAAMDDVRTGLAMGADDYIPKPFEPTDALGSIRVRLERAERIRHTREEQTRYLLRYLPHEIRTPLTGLLGYADLISETAREGRGLTPEETRQFATNLKASGNRLMAMMDTFTLWLELDARVREASPRNPVSNSGWREQVLASATWTAERYGRERDLSLNVAPAALNIPDGFMHRVVAQLVDNACKFTLPRTPIHLFGQMTPTGYQLTMVDHGPGIAEGFIPQIGTFRQSDRGHAEQQGIGLGLATCTLFAQMVNCAFFIRNHEGRGVEAGFTFHATQ